MDKLLLTFAYLLMPPASVLWAQGYGIRDNRILVEAKDDWMQWTYPKDVVDISEDGEVRPVYIRKDINACLDASSFVHARDAASPGTDLEIRGGIRAAGSNRRDTPNIMDGDIHTYWEPDRGDSLSQWWVEIDLGRLVSATRIVVKFVPEGEGDPFLKFKVYTAKGMSNMPGALDWRVVAHVLEPNTDGQRVFMFDLFPDLWSEGIGNNIQYVRILAMDSLRDRGEEVSREEYEGLPSELKGTMDHYKRFSSGKERYIPADAYEKLPVEQKGTIRYYRWELPRLAEVEVWALGDNIALGAIERGGSVSSSTRAQISGTETRTMMDGSYDIPFSDENDPFLWTMDDGP